MNQPLKFLWSCKTQTSLARRTSDTYYCSTEILSDRLLQIVFINCPVFYCIKLHMSWVFHNSRKTLFNYVASWWLPWISDWPEKIYLVQTQWTYVIFSNQAHFFVILFVKQECKKNIRNVQKMLYTYYHGCYGNIFFFHKFCEIWTFFKSSPFFLLLFLKQELKKNIRNVHKMFYTYYHGST